MITEQELEKVMDPDKPGTINWSVLEYIQDILKGKLKEPVPPAMGPPTLGNMIIFWIQNADFWDTKTYSVLKKFFGKDEKDDPEKIKTLESIVDGLLAKRKKASKHIPISYPIRKIFEGLKI